MANRLTGLQPLTQFTAEVNSEPFTSRAASVYERFLVDVSCFGNRLFGIAFGDLFLFHDDQITASSTVTPTTRYRCFCTTRRTR